MDQPGAPAPESSGEESVSETSTASGSLPGNTPASINPTPPPGSTNSTIGLTETAQLFSPTSLLASLQTQLLGEKTSAQQQAEQAAAARAQRRAAAERTAFENRQAQQQAVEQQRVQATVQLKSEARQLGGYDQSSVVLSQTTGGDLSEQTVVQAAVKTAQERHSKEQRARQMMAQQRQVKKGPQLEGGETKASMVDRMTGGSEAVTPAEDQDALQRQAEQALGE